MASSDPIQTSFNGGEISKRLWGRTDSELYKKGLAQCENWMPTPQGSLRMRRGTKTEVSLSLSGNMRAFEVPVAGLAGYGALLSDYGLSLFSDAGLVTFPRFSLVQNWSFNADHAINSSWWEMFRDTSGDPWPELVPNGGDSYVLLKAHDTCVSYLAQRVPFANGTYKLKFKTSAVTNAKFYVAIGGTKNVGTCYYREATIDENLDLEITINNANGEAWVVFGVIGTAGAGAGYGSLRLYWAAVDVAAGATKIPAPWSASQIGAVSSVSETGRDCTSFWHANRRPYEVVYTSGTWAWRGIPLVNKPADWGTVLGGNECWPAAAEIFQGRLWATGVPGQRSRLWGSKSATAASGSLYDFGVTSPTSVPSDAIDVSVATKNAALWLRGKKNKLFGGTDRGEFVCVAQDGLLETGGTWDFDAEPESACGSAPINAVDVGTQALYVSADYRKVRALSYRQESESWESQDITFSGEHITEAGIRELHFLRDPLDTIICVLADGTLACCTYIPGAVAAWWKFTLASSGTVKTACVIGSKLWLVVLRGSTYTLESWAQAEVKTGATPDFYLDSYVQCDVNGEFTAGMLSHLLDIDIAGVGSGYQKGLRAAGDGSYNQGDELWALAMGLAYTPSAQTLPSDSGGTKGTAQGMRRRFSRIWLRVADSALPSVEGEKVGPDTRTYTSSPANGDFVADALAGDTANGQLTITQPEPFRTEVLAVYGNAHANEV